MIAIVLRCCDADFVLSLSIYLFYVICPWRIQVPEKTSEDLQEEVTRETSIEKAGLENDYFDVEGIFVCKK